MWGVERSKHEKPTGDFGFPRWHTCAMENVSRLSSNSPLLMLGRLDGRLHNSTAADIFLARSRLEGAAALAGLAGVPVTVRDLIDWITGRSPPPRASEGLNDPIAVAAVFHVAIARDEDASDPVTRATLNVLRTVLDDRAAGETYGRDDLAHFGPLWRIVRDAADAPFPSGDLIAVAQRVFELAAITEAAAVDASNVVSVDGRSWELPSRSRDRNWLLATAVPRLLHRAGFTTRVHPALVLLPRFLPPSPRDLAEFMAAAMARKAAGGLRDLAEMERDVARLRNDGATKRSKAPLLARLQLIYPGLQPAAVAKLLNVTPQGARKLLKAAKNPITSNARSESLE